MAKKITVTVNAKRIFNKISTVTVYHIYKITDDMNLEPSVDEKGEVIKFYRRDAAERYCEKHDLCYIEIKHIFYR